MEPIVLFGIQFTLSLAAYLLIAFWYVVPRLSVLPRELALVPLLWVHAFRVVGGTILVVADGQRKKKPSAGRANPSPEAPGSDRRADCRCLDGGKGASIRQRRTR